MRDPAVQRREAFLTTGVSKVMEQKQGRRRRRRRPRRTARILATVALLTAFAASTALAAHLGLTLGSSSSSALGERVIVNSQGRTLYMLSPETSRRLLCKSSECLRFWPPLTVGSATAKLKNGPGVQGHLGILRRSNGTFQVTLRGVPLYRYSQDRAKGDVKGQGIESFGGTWHAATASSGETAHKAPAPSTQPPAPSAPSYPESTPMSPSPPVSTTPSPSSTPAPPPTPPPYQYPPY
jgi:predicted lipoprotein with Yx(FWY)xxD motif